MAVRAPKNLASRVQEAEAKSPLEAEIAAEQASALGRSGQRVSQALAAYRQALETGNYETERDRAVETGYGFLIQREFLGLRDRAAIIRDYDIPREIISRLGTSPKRL